MKRTNTIAGGIIIFILLLIAIILWILPNWLMWTLIIPFVIKDIFFD